MTQEVARVKNNNGIFIMLSVRSDFFDFGISAARRGERIYEYAD